MHRNQTIEGKYDFAPVSVTFYVFCIFLKKIKRVLESLAFISRYRDGSTNHHTSILSLPEAYEAGDNYYDALAKNMDANLAEADMESFKTEDIHALLTNLPPMCTDHLSQEVSTYHILIVKLNL